jgi:hypothetical protein
MFQHLDLLVVEQYVAVVKRVGEKLLGYDVFSRVQLVNIVAKKTVRALYYKLSAAEIEFTSAGSGNDVSIDGHVGINHRLEDLAKFFTQDLVICDSQKL